MPFNAAREARSSSDAHSRSNRIPSAIFKVDVSCGTSSPFSFVPFAFLVAVISNLSGSLRGSFFLFLRLHAFGHGYAVAARACVGRIIIVRKSRYATEASLPVVYFEALRVTDLAALPLVALILIMFLASHRNNTTISRFYFLTIQSTFETFVVTIKGKGDKFYINLLILFN